MKYLQKSFAGVLMLALLMTGCSKSDPAPSLAGTWVFKSATVTTCTNTTLNGTSGTCFSDCIQIWTATTITGSEIDLAPSQTANTPYTSTYTISGSNITESRTYPTAPTFNRILVYSFTLTATTLTKTSAPTSSSGGCTVVAVYTRN